jgi:hypothetical protein
MGAALCGGVILRTVTLSIPTTAAEWEAAGGANAAKCLDLLAADARSRRHASVGRTPPKPGEVVRVEMRHAFIGPPDDSHDASALDAIGARADGTAGGASDIATQSFAAIPSGDGFGRRVCQENSASIRGLSLALRPYGPSSGDHARPTFRELEGTATDEVIKHAQKMRSRVPLSAVMDRGVQRRAVSFLMANTRFLQASHLHLTRRVNTGTFPVLNPPLASWRVASLVDAFAKLEGASSGSVTPYGIDVWTGEDQDTLSDSVFLPLSFALISTERHARMNVFEFVAWVEMLCIMSTTELVRWVFHAMATLRAGTVDASGHDPMEGFPPVIVLPRWLEQFSELRLAVDKPSDPNRSLVVQIQRRARHNQEVGGTAKQPRTEMFSRLTASGVAARVGLTRAAELIFEDDFLSAVASSPQCVFHLEYLQLTVMRQTFGTRFWYRRRQEVLSFIERHRSSVFQAIRRSAHLCPISLPVDTLPSTTEGSLAVGEHPHVELVNEGWGLEMHCGAYCFLLSQPRPPPPPQDKEEEAVEDDAEHVEVAPASHEAVMAHSAEEHTMKRGPSAPHLRPERGRVDPRFAKSERYLAITQNREASAVRAAAHHDDDMRRQWEAEISRHGKE